MWVATKLGTKRPLRRPTDAMLLDQLGSDEAARQYKRWSRDYAGEIDRGPDEEIKHHYDRLKAAFDRENAEVGESQEPRRGGLTVDRPRAPVQERTEPRQVTSPVRSPDEIAAQDTDWTAPDLKGMPQRIPGWWTGDAMTPPPPEHEVPEFGLPRRTPGTHYVDPARQAVRPQPRQQTREEWVRGLAEKGIYLNPDGSRMTPEQMQLPLRYPGPNGPRVWQQFVDRSPETPAYAGRHRAAMVAYMLEKLAEHEYEPDPKWMAESPAYAAWFNRYKKMKSAGWDFTESGGGNHWHKEIDGKHHFLVSEPDGWTHYVSSSPHSYGGSFGSGPFKDIDEALLNIKLPTRGFSGTRTMEDSVHRPGGLPARTEPMEMLPGGPGLKGKFQTLNSVNFTWEEQ